MTRGDISHGQHRSIRFMAVALLLSCGVLTWMGWELWSSYHADKLAEERHQRIEELRGTIVHMDEVLTMSARMAVATGDLKWEERYHRFEPELDAAIKEAMKLAPEAYSGEMAALTDAANIKLVEMENRAFDLVRQGRTEEARAVLYGDDYERQKRIYSRGMKHFAQRRDRHLRLEELRGIIIHLDEVLTMSARMAAATGDLRWEQRYRSFEPELDAVIKEAARLAPGADSGNGAAKTDAANIKLVEMENRAFVLVREGKTDKAGALLFSNEYERQKQIYAEGMAEFAEVLSNTAATSLKKEQGHAFLHVALVILLVPLLLLVWVLVYRAVRNWQKALSASNRLLACQTEGLAEMNQSLRAARVSLEERVEERTQQLREKMEELRRFNQLAVGREKRMIELKAEINGLLLELGREKKYENPGSVSETEPLAGKTE